MPRKTEDGSSVNGRNLAVNVTGSTIGRLVDRPTY
jgi:hypothetical protein